MNANYVYFISSLPTLLFQAKLPFTFDEFIAKAENVLSPKDLDILKNLPKVDNLNEYSTQGIIKKILDFETVLRNELVKLRAARIKIDALQYLRPDVYAGPAIVHIALSAQRNPHVLDAEKILDEARWSYLDELSFGHYFDLDYLIIYAYKLNILERWDNVFKADKEKILEEVLWKSELAEY
ncbi:MAG: DUF2764 family protein [Candidatus Omnitrophota bacterium]